MFLKVINIKKRVISGFMAIFAYYQLKYLKQYFRLKKKKQNLKINI